MNGHADPTLFDPEDFADLANDPDYQRFIEQQHQESMRLQNDEYERRIARSMRAFDGTFFDPF